MLMPGTAITDTDTVATDGEATTGLTATTDTTDTVAMDGVATTGLTATTDTMERGLLRLSQ